MIHTNMLDPYTKGQIEKFDEDLQKRLNDTNFVDDVGADIFINDMDEYDEVTHGYVSNTSSNETYGGMMV